MSRVKTGVIRRHRHKAVLSQTKGFRGANTRLFKRASDALWHAGQYAFIGRRLRKRDMRRLWILRISAALREHQSSLNYSRFLHQLKAVGSGLNRKMLAELAVREPKAFDQILKLVSGTK